MINFGAGIGSQDGENFQEAGGKPLPPEGWGEFAIMKSEDIDGNLKFFVQNKAGVDGDIFLGFAGSEVWQQEQARNTLGKIIDVTGCQIVVKTFQDAMALNGLKLDIKFQHVNSKSLKDDGTPFKNARSKNYAPAGTKSSVSAPPPAAQDTADSPW